MTGVALTDLWGLVRMNLRSGRWLLVAVVVLGVAAGAALVSHSSRISASTAVPAATSQSGLSHLPLGASAAVGATLGHADHAYWVHGLSAANPAQRLRVAFSSRGVRVASGRSTLGLSLLAFGRAGAEAPVGPAAARVSADRVVYDRGSLREWYTNSPLGLEQGFDVARPPAGTSGLLAFSLAVRGDLRPRMIGGALQFTGAGVSLRYGDLTAFDASGRRLPASMSLRGERLILSVDARGARYPLRVDPSITQYTQAALLSYSGTPNGTNSPYIESVAVSGTTLVVGEPNDNNGQGVVYVYQEPQGGWANTSTPTATLTQADAATTGSDGFGTSVAIDSGTIVASAPYKSLGGQANGQGAVYLFTGSGASWTQAAMLSTSPPADALAGPEGTNGALAISGGTVVVGTQVDETSGNAGLYVYEEPQGGWTNTTTPTTELTATNPGDTLGTGGVAMTANTIVAGVPDGGSTGGGLVDVYVNNGSWPKTPTATLTGSDIVANSGDDLGASVAISGSTIAAGDPAGLNGNTSQGSVYVYTEPAGGWMSATQTAKLTVPTINQNQVDTYLAGSSVAIGSGMILAGAPDAPVATGGSSYNENGAVFAFNEPQSGWADSSVPTGELVNSNQVSGGSQLGTSVAASGTTVFATAPNLYIHGLPAAFVWNGPFSGLPPTYALSVSRTGTGKGTVTSTPAGISCGTTCAHSFTAGTAVTLSEKPASGSTFAGWSGACTGTGTCNVTMSAAKTVTASFKLIPPPNTTITLAQISSAKRKAVFYFKGSGGVGALHFQCKLDAGAWASCVSPKIYTGLAHGSHTFQVRAVDSRGKADLTPAKHAFTI